jgi:hypothetical protein
VTPTGQPLSIAPASAETDAVARFPRLAIASGIVNAVLVAWILGMWHSSFQLPLAAILLLGFVYVACAALFAAAGAHYYWRHAKFRSRFTQQELMLTWAAAWVWAPAVLLFLRRDFLWAPLLAALAAAFPACSMRWLRTKAERAHTPNGTRQPTAQPSVQPIFAETLQSIPWDWRGVVIAVCVYLACVEFVFGDTLFACIFAAVGAFLFAGQRAAAWDGRAEVLSSPDQARARLLWSTLLAVLFTAWALAPGGQAGSGFLVPATVAAKSASPANKPDIVEPGGPGDYQSVILWPLKPDKQEIGAPVLAANTSDLTKPQTIRFNGAYWYFQAPANEPGPRAHQAHGNPLDVSIHTVNFKPLMMQAHQKLAAPIRLSTLREMDVTVLNRDNARGLLSIGVLLTDSAAPGRPALNPLNLGTQPLISSQPDHFQVKTVSVPETLHFAVPSQGRMKRFDGITILILPDESRMERGARVAIDHFDLVPR